MARAFVEPTRKWAESSENAGTLTVKPTCSGPESELELAQVPAAVLPM